MRTVIFLGLLYIGNCINPTYSKTLSEVTIEFFAIIIVIAMIMDLVDFFNLKKK